MAKYRVVHRNPAGRIIGSADGFASENEAIRYVKSIAPEVSKGSAQGERLDIETTYKPAPSKGSSAGYSVVPSRPALPPTKLNPGCRTADGKFVPTPSCRGEVGFPLRLFTIDGKIVRNGVKVAETRGQHLILTRKGSGLSRADAKDLAKALKAEGYAIVKTISVEGPAGIEYGVYAHKRARAHAVS